MARNPAAQLRGLLPRPVRRRVQASLTYLLLIVLILGIAVGVYEGGVHLAELTSAQITLGELPWALALSLIRILLSYCFALAFAFVAGLAAARTRVGEKIILPALDILQSIPIVGFFPAAISFFIGITQGHRLGVEMAACFLIFTCQSWNLAFAVYEAVKTLPQDQLDAADGFGLAGSRRFWRLFAPACVPRLVYNSMLSWTNGWFFLVAAEIIAVGSVKYHLPGIGSFLQRAAADGDLRLVVWGLVSLTALIIAFDAFVWRPLAHWSARFKQDFSGGTAEFRSLSPSWFTTTALSRPFRPLRRRFLRMLRILAKPWAWALREILLPLLWDLPSHLIRGGVKILRPIGPAAIVALALLAGLGVFAAGRLVVRALLPPWPAMAGEIPLAILASTARLTLALALSLAWVLPVVLWTWNRPRLRQFLTTIAQVGASLPATALFPLIFLVTIRWLGGGIELTSLVLLLSGMQWYILFNALGGASTIPSDLADATRSLGLSKRQTWIRLVLPAIRAPLITGSLTAWGGGWNALVVSEYVTYQDRVLSVNGIGALLNRAVYQQGDTRAITLCIAALIGWIVLINGLVWRPLYRTASERYKFDAL